LERKNLKKCSWILSFEQEEQRRAERGLARGVHSMQRQHMVRWTLVAKRQKQKQVTGATSAHHFGNVCVLFLIH